MQGTEDEHGKRADRIHDVGGARRCGFESRRADALVQCFGTLRLKPFDFVTFAAERCRIVGAQGWQQMLEENKRRVADDWVQRPAFRDRFASMTDDQYVRALYQNAGVQPNESKINDLVQRLMQGRETRATTLRHIVDDAGFVRKEQNPAFVLMQYCGYLHRNPDEGSDNNLDGFEFWLHKLDQANGDFNRRRWCGLSSNHWNTAAALNVNRPIQ